MSKEFFLVVIVLASKGCPDVNLSCIEGLAIATNNHRVSSFPDDWLKDQL